MRIDRRILCGLMLVATAGAVQPAVAWEPSKTVEFVVPAGIGGGAGQMAQLIQGIIQKHHLMKTSMVVISKKGGSGAEGFLDVKNSRGEGHKIIITLSNLFTTPLATGSPFRKQTKPSSYRTRSTRVSSPLRSTSNSRRRKTALVPCGTGVECSPPP